MKFKSIATLIGVSVIALAMTGCAGKKMGHFSGVRFLLNM